MPPRYYRKMFLSKFLASIYDFWVWVAAAGRTSQLREKIIPFVPKNAKVAIDLATGTGENAIAIKKHFPSVNVFASDLSPAMIAVAAKKAKKQRLRIKFSVGDAVKTSYPSGKADFVSISFALHDLPHPQRLLVMKEALRILKKSGVFAVYDYHFPRNPLLWPILLLQFLLVENKDAYSFLKEDLAEELLACGYKKISWKTHYGGLAQVMAGTK